MDLYRLKGDPEDFQPLNLDQVFAKRKEKVNNIMMLRHVAV